MVYSRRVGKLLPIFTDAFLLALQERVMSVDECPNYFNAAVKASVKVW
jgi:hypothetical protein